MFKYVCVLFFVIGAFGCGGTHGVPSDTARMNVDSGPEYSSSGGSGSGSGSGGGSSGTDPRDPIWPFAPGGLTFISSSSSSSSGGSSGGSTGSSGSSSGGVVDGDSGLADDAAGLSDSAPGDSALGDDGATASSSSSSGSSSGAGSNSGSSSGDTGSSSSGGSSGSSGGDTSSSSSSTSSSSGGSSGGSAGSSSSGAPPPGDAGRPSADAVAPSDSAAPVDATGACTMRTDGYWRTHASAWPLGALSLGSVTYTESQGLALYETAPNGDASLILADQLMTALLNGSADPGVVAAAQDWLTTNGGTLPFGAPTSSAAGQQAVTIAAELKVYNCSCEPSAC